MADRIPSSEAGGLSLRCKAGGYLEIGGNIRVVITKATEETLQLQILAPKEVSINYVTPSG